MIQPLELNPSKLPGDIETFNLNELEKHRIRPTDILPPPEIAIKIYYNEDPEKYGILGTLGNFSTFIGKAKAKKTFFLGIAIASAISNKAIFRTFKGSLQPHHNTVLYFDTEQSKYHVHLALKRICRMAEIPDPGNLFVYGLRPEDTKTRLAFIEKKIYETENLGFVVIDGIRDLVYDINDPKEASEIAGKLLKWSEEKNIHIVTVLHQNKGDGNARGHLGTELVNKSETVLAVEKKENSEISVVSPVQCRNREPEPFAFEIDEYGIPFKVRVPQSEDKTGSAFDVTAIEVNIIFELLQMVFDKVKMEPLNYSDLLNQIKILSKSFFALPNPLGDNRIKSLITIARNENIIEQNPEHEKGKSKPYTLNQNWGLLSV
ncbi:AAA family ATPase [Chryseobacterium sp. A321]